MVGDDHERARAVRRVHAAGRVGQEHDPRPEPAEEEHGLDDEPGVVALVQVKPALEHHDLDAGESPDQQPALVPRRGGGRPAGQLVERDHDRVLELVRQAAEP